MLNYTIRRLIATIPIMLLMAFLVFGMLYLAPGDPATLIAGDHATPADIEAIRDHLGLNRPFLEQFGGWGWRVVQGDLGQSVFSGAPIAGLIQQRAIPTLSLMLLTLLISVAISVPLGVIAAARRNTLVDRLIMLFSVVGFSLPVFIVGYLLAYCFAIKLPLLPVQGYSPPENGIGAFLQGLILPAIALSFNYIALVTRVTRATMIDVLSQDYIRTARAKGIAARSVLFSHALRNSAVPISTIVGVGIAVLIGGSVIVETVFAIPGVGSLVVDAIVARDFPVIQGVLLVVSFIYVIVNLTIDLLYPIFDPRISY